MQQKNQYILYALYIFSFYALLYIDCSFYSTTFPSVSPPRYFLLFYTISTKNTIAKYMYNKMNKFKEGCNYMNLKKQNYLSAHYCSPWHLFLSALYLLQKRPLQIQVPRKTLLKQNLLKKFFTFQLYFSFIIAKNKDLYAEKTRKQ